MVGGVREVLPAAGQAPLLAAGEQASRTADSNSPFGRFIGNKALPGIPTIRVFEALACGIPLVSAPWQDEEGLFRPGEEGHDELAALLGIVEAEGFARLVGSPAAQEG